MTEIPSFSDLFALLAPPFMPEDAPAEGTQPQAPPASDTPQQADTVVFSGLQPGADAADATPRAVSVADNGTYSPALQTTRRLGMSFGFEFNLSIQRQASFARQPPPEPGSSRTASIAREAAARYRSGHPTSAGNTGSSLAEARRFQTELFYNRTRDLSVRLHPEQAQRFDATSQRVARTFELNISLDVSFLGQFVQQSEDISNLDTGLFDRYLSNTDGLAGISGGDLQAFFDNVSRILKGSRQFALDTLGSFLQETAKTFGLTDDDVGRLHDLTAGQITSFFEEIDGFLTEARTALGSPPEPQGQLSPPVEQSAPAVETNAGEPEAETAETAAV